MVRLGPLLMTVSLAALAVLLPLQDGMPVPVHSVLLAVTLAGVGLGVGLGWPHLLTRVMKVAVAGEENLAASAITTVQLYAMAIGAALAGLVANAAGLTAPGGVVWRTSGGDESVWFVCLGAGAGDFADARDYA